MFNAYILTIAYKLIYDIKITPMTIASPMRSAKDLQMSETILVSDSVLVSQFRHSIAVTVLGFLEIEVGRCAVVAEVVSANELVFARIFLFCGLPANDGFCCKRNGDILLDFPITVQEWDVVILNKVTVTTLGKEIITAEVVSSIY